MIKTGLKFLPIAPSQKRLNWLANYIDLKRDALYSSIFAYQLMEAYLRGLIFKKTKNHESADKFGFKTVVDSFVDVYPQQKKLGDKLKTWAIQRDIVVHRLLINTRIKNAQKLDFLIKKVSDNGLGLFLKLKNVKHK